MCRQHQEDDIINRFIWLIPEMLLLFFMALLSRQGFPRVSACFGSHTSGALRRNWICSSQLGGSPESLRSRSPRCGVRTARPAWDTGKETHARRCGSPSSRGGRPGKESEMEERQEEIQGNEEVVWSGWRREKLDCALS